MLAPSPLPTSRLCIQCDILVCQLSPLQVGAILDFSGVGDRHSVYFAKCGYNKGMQLFHITLCEVEV